MSAHFLTKLFEPTSVAVVGASESADSVAGQVLRNIRDAGFRGAIHPVNPKHERVFGLPCYESVAHLPSPVDLAAVATPAASVPGVLRQLAERGTRTAIVHSAGFGQGRHGDALKRDLVDVVRSTGIRVLGPNCLGLIRPSVNLNATFSLGQAQPGSLALVSQSGALCTAILDWAAEQGIGFSCLVSVGDAADVGLGDVLDYLATDPKTQSTVLYVEGVRDARRFMSGLRSAARLKPVIVVKAGRFEAGARAARSHTGSLVGGDDVFDAALRRAGAVRAMTLGQLFSGAQLLGEGQRVRGNRLAIVTNAGGPGVLAADRAVEAGVELAALEASTIQRLDACLPPHWSHGNPVDILGDAGPQRYGDAVRACLDDGGVDGLLVILTPQAMTSPRHCAQEVASAARQHTKPVIACWMGGKNVASAREVFSREHVPSFHTPEASLDAFSYLWAHHQNQKLLRQVPGPLSYQAQHDVEGARLVIDGALSAGRSTLTARESKAVLHAFGIPTTSSFAATSPADALVVAESIGFPLAMKVDVPELTHKSDAGGVRLDVRSATEVRRVYSELVAGVKQRTGVDVTTVTLEAMHGSTATRELMVGVVRDVAFGPVIVFGVGGTLVEVLKDRALALPPLNAFIARDLVGRTKAARLLAEFRGKPAVSMAAVEETLLRVSDLVCELPEIRELDINPLHADAEGVMAVDARIVVQRPPAAALPHSHMAVRPYPSNLVQHHQLADGTDVTIRPIRPEDAEIERSFVNGLSKESKYFRFMHGLAELTQEMLIRFTQIDYDREMAFIATTRVGEQDREIGVSRYVTNPDGESCEFALVVADEWQHRGIGTQLMVALIDAARNKRLARVVGEVLSENRSMLALVASLGFRVEPHPREPSIRVVTLAL